MRRGSTELASLVCDLTEGCLADGSSVLYLQAKVGENVFDTIGSGIGRM